MTATINGREWRLEPEEVSGKGWRVVVTTGHKKKGTKISVPVSEPVYTLAQAQAFIANSRTTDFSTDIAHAEVTSRLAAAGGGNHGAGAAPRQRGN
jgi:hypothetical protein